MDARSIVAGFVALLMAGCDLSPQGSGNTGITVIAPLAGQAATNQAQYLERIRHLPKTAPFEPRTFASTGASTLKYLLFKPKSFSAEKSYPLVLFLHGGAGRHDFQKLAEPSFAYGLGRFVFDDTQDAHPCFVLAPWSNEQGWDENNLRLIVELLDALAKEFKIDGKRIYVTGQSMGGWGTWAIIAQHPDRFAAAVPICGGGDPGDAARAKGVPVWAFHGSADRVVSVAYTRAMIQALRKAGATPRYWEYQDAEHAGTAERAYCEADLVAWMFAKSTP